MWGEGGMEGRRNIVVMDHGFLLSTIYGTDMARLKKWCDMIGFSC